MESLTPKQQLFVDHYLTTFNATESARRAGYKGNDVTLGAVGAENLKKPQIISQLTKRFNQVVVKNERRIVNVYDEFLEQLEFAKKLREQAELLTESPDANDRKFAIDAVKVCDLCIDKFAKIEGIYTKEKDNPQRLAEVVYTVSEQYRIAYEFDKIYKESDGRWGKPMLENFLDIEIERYAKHHQQDPDKVRQSVQADIAQLGVVG